MIEINRRKRLLQSAHHLVWAAMVTFTFVANASAATYTVDLTGITNDANPEANYLQSDFDFGTRFSNIESLRLEFTMPTGYGTAFSTGNSSFFSHLRVVIHDEEFDLRLEQTSDDLQPWPPTSQGSGSAMQNSAFALPEQLTKVDFGGVIVNPGEQPPRFEITGPDFLFTGRGLVTLQAWAMHSYHPIGSDISEHRDTISVLMPPPVTYARLVIEAIPVPEPATFSLVCMFFAASSMKTRRR